MFFAVHQARSNNIRLIAGLLLLGIFVLSLINTLPLASPTSDTLEELQPSNEPTPVNMGDPGQVEETDPAVRIEETNPISLSTSSSSSGRNSPILAFDTLYFDSVNVTRITDHTLSKTGSGNDTLRVATEFAVDETANYEWHAYLYTNTTASKEQIGNTVEHTETYYSASNPVVTLDFNGYAIRKYGADGPFSVEFQLRKENSTGWHIIVPQQNLHNTTAYLALDFPTWPIAVVGYSHYPVNVDANGLYDWLYVKIDVDVSCAADYFVIANLAEFTGGYAVDSGRNESYCTVGSNAITVRFAGWKFRERALTDSYNLSFYIRFLNFPYAQFGDLVNENDAYNTGSYSWNQFDEPPLYFLSTDFSHSFEDTEPDGLINYLKVNGKVVVTRQEEGYFSLRGELRLNASGIAQYIDTDWFSLPSNAQPGTYDVSWKFSGINIRKSMVNATDSLDLYPSASYAQLYNWPDDSNSFYPAGLAYSINSSSTPSLPPYSQFEGPGAFLTGSYVDLGIDTDGGGYDYLVVRVGLSVIVAGYYQVSAYLQWNASGTWKDIQHNSNQTYFTAGTYFIELRYTGAWIYREGVNDYLAVRDVYLYGGDPWTQLELVSRVTLNSYNYLQFDPPHAKFTMIFDDSVEDLTGAVGLWDHLIITIEVYINKTGRYKIDGRIGNPITDQDLSTTSDYLDFTVGKHSVELKFDGKWIWKQHTATTYALEYVEIWQEGIGHSWDYKSNPYVTDTSYVSDDFEHPDAYFTDVFEDVPVTPSPYKFLNINAEVQVEVTGDYRLKGNLYSAEADWYSGWYYAPYATYSPGLYNLTLSFPGDIIWRLNEDSISFTVNYLELEKEEFGNTDSRYRSYTTQTYDSSDFAAPPALFTDVFSDYGWDSDADGDYNYINVTIEIAISETGKFYAYGYVRSNETSNSQYFSTEHRTLNPATHTLTAAIDGNWFRRQPDTASIYIDSLYVYVWLDAESTWRMVDERYNDDMHVFNTYTDDQFDTPAAAFTGVFSDYGLDTDNDGSYNYLVVVVGIQVTEGPYQFRVEGTISNGTYERWQSNYTTFDVGNHEIQLRFETQAFQWEQTTNIVNLTYVNIYLAEGDWSLLEEINDPYTLSRPYSWMEFDPIARVMGFGYSLKVDTNGNGLAEYLDVEMDLWAPEAGTYRIYTYWQPEMSFDSYFSLRLGYQTIVLRVPMYTTAATGEIHLQLSEVGIWKQFGDWVGYSSWRSYWLDLGTFQRTEFDPTPATYLRLAGDAPKAVDSDSLYDFLAVYFEVNITLEGDYTLYAYLVDKDTGDWIASKTNYTHLLAGLQNVSIWFDSNSIRSNAGEPSIFKVGEFEIKYRDPSLNAYFRVFYENEIGETSSYYASDFDDSFEGQAPNILSFTINGNSTSPLTMRTGQLMTVEVAATDDFWVSQANCRIHDENWDYNEEFAMTQDPNDLMRFVLNTSYYSVGRVWVWVEVYDNFGWVNNTQTIEIDFVAEGAVSIVMVELDEEPYYVNEPFGVSVWIFKGNYSTEEVWVSWDRWDEGARVYATKVWEDALRERWNATLTFSWSGTQELEAYAKDASGSVILYKIGSIFILEELPPGEHPEIFQSIEFEPEDQSVRVGEEVHIMVTLETTEVIITSVTLNFDDKSVALSKTYEDGAIEIWEATFSFDSAGRKMLVIRVMTTGNEAIEATEYFDVLKERKKVSSPGFELLLTILALASLPILLRRLRRTR